MTKLELEETSQQLTITTENLVATTETLQETKVTLCETKQDRDEQQHLVGKHVEAEENLFNEAKQVRQKGYIGDKGNIHFLYFICMV